MEYKYFPFSIHTGNLRFTTLWSAVCLYEAFGGKLFKNRMVQALKNWAEALGLSNPIKI